MVVGQGKVASSGTQSTDDKEYQKFNDFVATQVEKVLNGTTNRESAAAVINAKYPGQGATIYDRLSNGYTVTKKK